MTKGIFIGLFLGSLAPWNLQSAEDILPASAFAFPSVQEAGGARAIGLGSAYVGLAEGSTALLWNPAGLSNLNSAEIGLHHQSALVGSNQEILMVGLPLGARHGLGLSFNYEDNGIFDGRDSNGVQTGDYSARAYGAGLGLGLGGPGGTSIGLGIKLNSQDLAGTAYTAFAADLGLLWSPEPEFSLGIAYTNFGPDVAGRPLAQGLRGGVASYLGKGSDFQWLLALSGESLTRGADSLHAGLEHTLFQVLSLRAGYAAEIPSREVAGLVGWNFGGGIMIQNFSIDYTFTPLADLGNTQRVSLTYAFQPRRPVATTARPAKKLTAPAEAVWRVKASPVPTKMENYVVKKGDTLWSIAGKNRTLGDSFRWSLLFDANRNQIIDPDEIEVDQNLAYKARYTRVQNAAAEKKGRDREVFVPNN